MWSGRGQQGRTHSEGECSPVALLCRCYCLAVAHGFSNSALHSLRAGGSFQVLVCWRRRDPPNSRPAHSSRDWDLQGCGPGYGRIADVTLSWDVPYDAQRGVCELSVEGEGCGWLRYEGATTGNSVRVDVHCGGMAAARVAIAGRCTSTCRLTPLMLHWRFGCE